MRIHVLQLPVSDVTRVSAWFLDVLQLPVRDAAVQIGWTTLELRQAGADPVGGVHLAFNVPHNRFLEAAAWLKGRAPLQRNAEGREHFTFEGRWDSESVYFTGPDGLILELIARRRLPGSGAKGDFQGSELTCISEVGLPAMRVAEVQAQTEAMFGLEPLSPPTPVFAPMGDDEGLLVLVDATRHWFPEQQVLPNARGIEVMLRGVRAPARMDDIAQGWTVRSC